MEWRRGAKSRFASLHYSITPSLPSLLFSHEIPSPHLEQLEAEEGPHAADAAVDPRGIHPVRVVVCDQTGADRRREAGGGKSPGGEAQGFSHSVASGELQSPHGAYSRGGGGDAPDLVRRH